MSSPTSSPKRFAPTSLLVGNFVVGTSVLAPAGMLNELAAGFAISIRQASLLITFGAVVMCIGSPLLAWWTSRVERRTLLGVSLGLIALGHFGSAYAPSFPVLLAMRMVQLAAAAPFSPQAASSVPALVPESRRSSAIAFVFLGWSLASAVGVPIITNLAHAFDWRAAYGFLGVVAACSCAFLYGRMPRGIFTAPVQLTTWSTLARTAPVPRLLVLTVLLTSGQFVVFTFLAPLLRVLGGASAGATSVVFGLFGVAGVLGNVVATNVVAKWGPYKTSRTAVTCLLIGVLSWSAAAPSLYWMAAAVFVWGLGFASNNSMQQARLVAAAPPAAGASVALNTSAIYVGQAFGSALGGALFAAEAYAQLGFVAAGFMFIGVMVLVSTKPASA